MLKDILLTDGSKQLAPIYFSYFDLISLGLIILPVVITSQFYYRPDKLHMGCWTSKKYPGKLQVMLKTNATFVMSHYKCDI